MNTILKTTAIGALMLAGISAAAAQTIVVQPEQQTVIREYVVQQNRPVVEVPGVELSVGTVVPDTIELYAVEAPELTDRYEYVVMGERTYLVEPGTRRVVQIIE